MPIVRRSRSDLDLGKVDWSGVDATTDADLEAQIAADLDTAPLFTDEELATARIVRAPDTADDVRAIRRRLGLSQAAFPRRFGFSVASVRNWEQGHRRPEGAARVLLRVIAREPDAVTRAITR